MRVFLLAPLLSLLPYLPLTSPSDSHRTQATSSARPGPGQSSSGGAAGSPMASYHNDTLHLTYHYPASWTDASSIVGPAFQASMNSDVAATAAEAKCVSLPFSRSNLGNGQVAFVLLVRADASCLKKKFDAGSLPEFTEGEAKGLAASGAKTAFGQPVSYAVADHPASVVKGSFTLPTGQSLNAMIVCVLTQPDVACWQFLSAAPAALNTMAAFPVSFDGGGGGAAPLVPATVAAKP